MKAIPKGGRNACWNQLEEELSERVTLVTSVTSRYNGFRVLDTIYMDKGKP